MIPSDADTLRRLRADHIVIGPFQTSQLLDEHTGHLGRTATGSGAN